MKISTFLASASHAFEIASPNTVPNDRHRLRRKWVSMLNEISSVHSFLSALLDQRPLGVAVLRRLSGPPRKHRHAPNNEAQPPPPPQGVRRCHGPAVGCPRSWRAT